MDPCHSDGCICYKVLKSQCERSDQYNFDSEEKSLQICEPCFKMSVPCGKAYHSSFQATVEVFSAAPVAVSELGCDGGQEVNMIIVWVEISSQTFMFLVYRCQTDILMSNCCNNSKLILSSLT